MDHRLFVDLQVTFYVSTAAAILYANDLLKAGRFSLRKVLLLVTLACIAVAVLRPAEFGR